MQRTSEICVIGSRRRTIKMNITITVSFNEEDKAKMKTAGISPSDMRANIKRFEHDMYDEFDNQAGYE